MLAPPVRPSLVPIDMASKVSGVYKSGREVNSDASGS